VNCSGFHRLAEEEDAYRATLPGFHGDSFADGAVK
jgi:hypothetical protein